MQMQTLIMLDEGEQAMQEAPRLRTGQTQNRPSLA